MHSTAGRSTRILCIGGEGGDPPSNVLASSNGRMLVSPRAPAHALRACAHTCICGCRVTASAGATKTTHKRAAAGRHPALRPQWASSATKKARRRRASGSAVLRAGSHQPGRRGAGKGAVVSAMRRFGFV